jgi:hypothetical protein
MSAVKHALGVAAVVCALCLAGCKDSSMASTPFKNPCTTCNPDKPKPLQSINRVGTQAFKRDSSGNIISKNDGHPGLAGHGGAPGVGFVVQPVKLQLQDGSWINATKSLGKSTTDGTNFIADHRMDADCHGVSFTDGEYWIDDGEVTGVLKGGGFKETTTPKPGDIGVIRDKRGNVVHSVTVTKVDPTTGAVVEVSGLGGLEMHEHVNTPADAWGDPNAKITYYTK